MIEQEVEKFLVSLGYDVSAIPYDYTIEEPSDANKVADNLKVLKQQFQFLQPEYMNNKEKHQPVHEMMERIKGEVTPVITGFIRSSRVVVSYYLGLFHG